MTQYLVAIHHPADFDPGSESEETRRDIAALNREMEAAGIRVFVGGLAPVRMAKSVRVQRGELAVTDGPYAEAKEYVGGFWVLDCTDMDDAVAWGRKAAKACRTPVEVRAFN